MVAEESRDDHLPGFRTGSKSHLCIFLAVGPAGEISLRRRVSDGRTVRKGPTLRHAATLVSLATEEVPLAIRDTTWTTGPRAIARRQSLCACLHPTNDRTTPFMVHLAIQMSNRRSGMAERRTTCSSTDGSFLSEAADEAHRPALPRVGILVVVSHREQVQLRVVLGEGFPASAAISACSGSPTSWLSSPRIRLRCAGICSSNAETSPGSRTHQAVPRDELDNGPDDDGRRRHHQAPSGASSVDQDASGFRVLSFRQFGNPGQAYQGKIRYPSSSAHYLTGAPISDVIRKSMACRSQLSRAAASGHESGWKGPLIR